MDLKNQLFLLIVLPAIFAAVFVGCAALFLQQQDLQKQFTERGRLLLDHYRRDVQAGIQNGDKSALDSLANKILNEDSVRAIGIYATGENKVLTYAGPRMRPTMEPGQFANWFAPSQRFSETLRLDNKNFIFEVELDRNLLILREYESLFLVWFAAVLSFIFALVFAQYTASRYSEPIRSISHAIARIREGQLSTRVQMRVPAGELRELIWGVNTMAESLQNAHEEMQSHVDQATEDLRSTLETIEIQNIELDFARKEAEQASHIKSQFLANISHEIRTPLNSIIGFTNILLNSELNERQQDQLQTIQKSSENLLAIINDILDFSKIEAGKLSLEIESVNIRALIEEVTNLLAPLAREKKLKQVLRIEEDIPELIMSDSLRIKQILTNLISNAIKFSDKGSLIIRVVEGGSKGGQSYLKFSVSDQGIGLSEAAKEKLFDAFHQSDSSNVRRFQGTGLGLTISRHLVEMLGGEIGVESSLGEGSTFWFTLPSNQVQDTQNLITASSKLLNQNQPNDSGKPKILAVDDNAANLKLLCALMEDLGIDYDACSSGRQAIQLNEQNNYDLIFMDIQMPDLDGIEATRHIREFDKRFSRHRAIIALTAHALEEEKQAFLDKGFNHCLTKPIDTELLVATIEHWTGFTPKKNNPVAHSALRINETPVIDINEGLRLSNNKADLADEMLEMLVSQLEQDVLEIKQYQDDKNFQALFDKVHYVHGACRYCGVPLLRAATVTVENMLKQKQHDLLHDALVELELQAKVLLESYQQRSKPIHASA